MDETATALVTEPAEIDMIVEERAAARARDLFKCIPPELTPFSIEVDTYVILQAIGFVA